MAEGDFEEDDSQPVHACDDKPLNYSGMYHFMENIFICAVSKYPFGSSCLFVFVSINESLTA